MLVGVTGAAMAWSTFMHAGATVSLGGRCHTEVFGMLLIDGHCQWSQRRRYDCRVNCVYVYLNICMVYVYVYIYINTILITSSHKYAQVFRTGRHASMKGSKPVSETSKGWTSSRRRRSSAPKAPRSYQLGVMLMLI